MLQLKISRTKKRLSSEHWVLPVAIIASMGLLFVLNTAMRMATLSHAYGIVRGTIPVLPIALKDSSPQRLKLDQAATMSENTTAVVIGANQDLYFGPIKSFSTDYPNARSKFVIKNRQGSAQINELLKTVKKWLDDRWQVERIENDQIVVLIPAASTPVSVVTQAMAQLRAESMFKHVIVANGLY